MTATEKLIIGAYAGIGWTLCCLIGIAAGAHCGLLLSFLRECFRNQEVREWAFEVIRVYHSIARNGKFPEQTPGGDSHGKETS
jgi:hypothetical protein